jgi:glyoxylase-like metal-dependent hydrolase (beta-lactamase superfamily II)
MFNIGEGDCFQMSSNKIELKLKVIETPGHLSDHLCYLLHEKSKG